MHNNIIEFKWSIFILFQDRPKGSLNKKGKGAHMKAQSQALSQTSVQGYVQVEVHTVEPNPNPEPTDQPSVQGLV